MTSSTPSFNVDTVTYEPLPGFGGGEAILYKSDDGRRLAGSFKESGTHTMVLPYDEFLYLVGGTVKITVGDGEPIELAVGDCCYLREGDEVTFEMSDDFHDVTVLISDGAIAY